MVFGVKDVTFELLGLPEATTDTLADTHRVLQKLNRYISPPITMLRSKKHLKEDKNFVIFYIPESIGKTHIVIKEGKFSFPSGDKKILLRPGMIYMRRSASNHIINPSDFESLLNRRIENYKKILFDRIALVADAPIEDSILVVNTETGEGTKKEFTVSGAPDAIPVKGMSFSVTPKTDEQEIAALIALSKKDPEDIPRSQKLWRFYSRRHELSLNTSQLHAMAKFCLLSGVPAFFWTKAFTAAEFKDVLEEAIVSTAPNFDVKATIVKTGAFLGKGFKNSLIKKLGRKSERLSSSTLSKRTSDPREFFYPRLVEPLTKESKASESSHRDSLEKEVTELAIELSENNYDTMKKTKAVAIDCYLYARDDRYMSSKKT